MACPNYSMIAVEYRNLPEKNKRYLLFLIDICIFILESF